MSLRRHLPATSTFVIACLLSVVSIPAFAEMSNAFFIDHEAVSQWPAGQRIEIAALVADRSDVVQVRAYFKSKNGKDFVFMPMDRDGQRHRVLLPAPLPNHGSIEYRLIAVTGSNDVFGSELFEIEITDSDPYLPASAGPITVFTESAHLSAPLVGFADTLSIAVVDSEARIGLGAEPNSRPRAAPPSYLAQSQPQGSATQHPRWLLWGAPIAAGIVLATVLLSGDDGDRPPRFASDALLQLIVAENRTGNIGSPVSASDPDGDPISYTLSGADASFFAISATAQLSVGSFSVMDYETQDEYNFQVVATANGQSATRDVFLALADLEEPPDPVDAPTVSNVSQTSATVSWTVPENQGPPVNDYDVRYRQLAEEWIDPDFVGTSTSTNLAGLTEGTTYEVQVRASNDEGTGEWSESTEFETETQSPIQQDLAISENQAANDQEATSYAQNSTEVIVESIEVTSSPGADGVYTAGEDIEIVVSFTQRLAVSGGAALKIEMGRDTVWAEFVGVQDSQATEHLSFRYRVGSGDVDSDGISIMADVLELNVRASVNTEEGRSLLLSIGPHTIVNDRDHVVDAADPERASAVLGNALAAQARAQLTSVRGVVSARFLFDSESARTNARDAVPPPRHQRGRLRQEVAQNDWSFGTLSGSPSVNRSARDMSLANQHFAVSLLSGTPPKLFASQVSHELALGRVSDDGPKPNNWMLWSTWDTQRHAGGVSDGQYDGDLSTLYVGVDGRIGTNWLVGTAISRSEGEVSYSFAPSDAASEGTLRTRSASLNPYFKARLFNGFELWAIGGIGDGEAELGSAERQDLDRTDLRVQLGAIGVRKELVETPIARLSIVMDTGYSRFQTGTSTNRSLDKLSASISQVRFGLEGAHEWELLGNSLLPYWRVSGRYDGGTGISGKGLEVLGRATYQSNRLRLVAEGRWLAKHEVQSTEEFGTSVSLDIEPGERGLGWSASLSSQRGASGEADNSAGQNPHMTILTNSRIHSGQAHSGEAVHLIDGRVSYGFSLPGTASILTSFSEVRRTGTATELHRLGIGLNGVLGGRPMRLELTLGQRSTVQELIENQIGLEFGLVL